MKEFNETHDTNILVKVYLGLNSKGKLRLVNFLINTFLNDKDVFSDEGTQAFSYLSEWSASFKEKIDKRDSLEGY